MYKCEKNVTCNFGEVSFMKEYCIESKEEQLLKESPDEKCIINDVFTLYLRYHADVHLSQRQKQTQKRASSK